MPKRTRLFPALAALALATAAFGGHAAFAQAMGHGGTGMHMHGADGTGHDEVTMPGLRGGDVTKAESAEMELMFRRFESLDREVAALPNGIRTVTWSDDPEVLDALVSHVIGMIARVEDGRDPEVFIQSPTLDLLFERRETIATEIEMIEGGIVVVQTSDDPEVVATLQKHAGEVTDMVNRGMISVHERMMAGN